MESENNPKLINIVRKSTAYFSLVNDLCVLGEILLFLLGIDERMSSMNPKGQIQPQANLPVTAAKRRIEASADQGIHFLPAYIGGGQ